MRGHPAHGSENAVKTPYLVQGEIHKDERGAIASVNGFPLENAKRFYVISNRSKGVIRAWQGHEKETKFFFALEGSYFIGVVRVPDFKNPPDDAKVAKFVLESGKPQILVIPPGHANGIRALSDDNKLLIFSSFTLKESEEDTHRFPPDFWFEWKV
jgi:dTDP-4-dehydrorhamnose 3,5-epimerase